jgi:tRNA threonylcarbamoyladenosine biosynthesis protein TsaE
MKRLGAVLAQVLAPGDTVLLGGDLGAGKTTFVQGLASALGVAGPVTSPTFVLLRSYRTSPGWDLLHADVWRLEQLREVIELAIPELVEEGAAVVVEWGELAAPALATDCLHVVIDFAPADGDAGSAPSGGSPVEVPSTAVPGADGPGADGPGADGPGADGPGADGPGADGPGADGVRRVSFHAVGQSWAERMGVLGAALAA